MGFKENLKTELSYSGMLVKELAELSGINKHTIDNYLNVKSRIPSAENAVRIARVLGVSVEYLVTGTDEYGRVRRVANDGESRGELCQEARTVARIVSELEVKNRKVVLAVAKTLKTGERMEHQKGA
jgi:transcriptional regulator with XRE-family HTH domain